MANRIKYIRHAAWTEAQWQSRNPYLWDGEIAFIKDVTGKTVNSKVGPGFYNDLAYFSGSNYPYSDAVTNVIGDATGVLQGLSVAEILHKMLNPYLVPVLSAPRNNGGVVGGAFSTIAVREIGQALNTNVLVQYNRTNHANLLGATPININTAGAFSNDGNFADGQIILIPSGSISPTLPTTINIKIKGTHVNGLTNEVITQLRWDPRIIAGCSALADLSSGADVNALTSKVTFLSNTLEVDIFFGAGGYLWIALPSMLFGAQPLVFTDITDPNAPANISFIAKGAMMVNNGVGNYSMQLYRSPYSLTVSSTRIRIRRSA